MSRWPRQFWSGGFSPFGSREQVPNVTDDDFSYITSQDLEEPARTYDPVASHHRTPPSQQPEDDVILLKHKNTTYPLKFPAYTIADGRLQVRDVRRRAAESLGVSDPGRLKLVYKGTQLKDDHAPAHEYNVKNMSEVLCIVGDRSKDDISDDEPPSKSKKKSKSKRKTKKSGGASSVDSGSLDGSATNETPTPTASPMPPADANTPLGKLAALSNKFYKEILPPCEAYIASPPSEPKKKDFEHKRLGEVVMRDILLKLDAVETEGNADARQKRKDLVREAQNILNRLDTAAA